MNTWGILPLDKPEGWTSHDAVDRVRKNLGTRKVGHAGTLDPLATGVLVLCVGQATRLSPYLTAHAKYYRARVCLGVRTNTMDAEGEVLSRIDDIPLAIDEITPTLESFRGAIQQTPPMFSAKKIGGKRLHRLARAGKVVERAPIDVHVEILRAEGYEPPYLDLHVACSKGTYVRVLADDIGQTLGCGAHIASLRRTASGPITIAQCRSIDELDDIERTLMDPNEALADLPEVALPDRLADRFTKGTAVSTGAELEDVDGPIRVRSERGALLGIGSVTAATLTPKCVLSERSDAPRHA